MTSEVWNKCIAFGAFLHHHTINALMTWSQDILKHIITAQLSPKLLDDVLSHVNSSIVHKILMKGRENFGFRTKVSVCNSLV